ncbi:hypothetical protein Tco_0149555 [Tanacetum coccineum]
MTLKHEVLYCDPKLFYKDGAYASVIQLYKLELERLRKWFELVSPCHFSSNIDMALPLRNERHLWLRFNTQGYTEEEIYDFETTLERLYYRKVLFTSSIWRELMGIRRPLVREIILEFFSMLRQFIAILGLHTVEEMETDGFRACWDASLRVIASKAELVDYWVRISSSGDGGECPLLAFIVLVHIYLGKHRAQMSRGHFIARLRMHFGVITKQSLRTLTMEVCELTTIDIEELIRLWICERLLDVVRWVALGLQRQQAKATCGAAEADPKGLQEDIPAGQKGKSLGEQRVLFERMSSNHARFSTWMVGLMTQLIKKSGMRYMRFDGTNVGDSHVQFKRRRVKPRNDDAITLVAQQTQPQPDP